VNRDFHRYAALCILALTAGAGCPAQPQDKSVKGAISGVIPPLAIDVVLEADAGTLNTIEESLITEAAAQTDNGVLQIVVQSLLTKQRKCEAVNFIRSHFRLDPIACSSDQDY
jgi:hypothetical protein